MRGHTYPTVFIVLEQCSRDVILGVDFLSENSVVINLQAQTPDNAIAQDPSPALSASLAILDEHITLPPRSSTMIAVGTNNSSCVGGLVEANPSLLFERGLSVARGIVHLVEGTANILINFCSEYRHLIKGTTVALFETIPDIANILTIENELAPRPSDVSFDVNPALSQDRQERLQKLLHTYQACFATSSKIRHTTLTKHRIITDESARPIHQSPYRVSMKEREAIRKQIKEMLHDDVIEPSQSPWASPVVLVKKRDNTLRLCVDYRRLNKVTRKDVYPLPRIDDALDRLCNARYFSSMDLKSGYWQLEVDERDREKIAFITPDGLYQFKVMPFGLCTAPATFQRVMDTVLAGLKWQTCLVYLDDVIVFASTFKEHLSRLEVVLRAIKSSGLTLKSEKCRFAYEQLKFLGHVVSSAGVLPHPEKTAAVRHFPQPR